MHLSSPSRMSPMHRPLINLTILSRTRSTRTALPRASLTSSFSSSSLSNSGTSNDARADGKEINTDDLPLSGVRILELGQLIAGPFAGQLLGHFGATIIKVEPPNTGDPLRVWRELDVDGVSPWFRSIARNKKSVAVDLRSEKGRDLVRKLALKSDVIIENFKPGTLEKWSLDPASLHPTNPNLLYTRVSGYGQTGPWAARPGYASVCEAESGFRYVNGNVEVDSDGEMRMKGAPVRPNMSLGDSVAGVYAAFGTVLALLARRKKMDRGLPGGQTVDVSILESMLNLMEGMIPEYDRKGKIRGPSGSSLTGIVPTNAYPCLPSPTAPNTPSYIVIGANGDTVYNRLMTAIGRTDLIGDEYKHNNHRVARQEEIESAIRAWTRERSKEEVLKLMNEAGVPVGRVVSVKEVVEGEHVKARGAVEEVWVPSNESGKGQEAAEGWSVKMGGAVPVLEGCDTRTRWAGPDLGEHTEEVLCGELGLKKEELEDLRAGGVVG